MRSNCGPTGNNGLVPKSLLLWQESLRRTRGYLKAAQASCFRPLRRLMRSFGWTHPNTSERGNLQYARGNPLEEPDRNYHQETSIGLGSNTNLPCAVSKTDRDSALIFRKFSGALMDSRSGDVATKVTVSQWSTTGLTHPTKRNSGPITVVPKPKTFDPDQSSPHCHPA